MSQTALKPLTLEQNLQSSDAQLSSKQKAVIILSVLEAEMAGRLIEKIGERRLRQVAKAMTHLSRVPAPVIDRVVTQFLEAVEVNDGAFVGGQEQAKSLLTKFVSDDTMKRLMEDLDELNERSVWDRLGDIGASEVTDFLKGLHPQAACVILSKIEPEKASEILDILPEDRMLDLVSRMGHPLEIDREALNELSDYVMNEFLRPLKEKSASRNPGDVIATVINGLPFTKKNHIVDHITEKLPEVGQRVKSSMLSFADIESRLPAIAVPVIIRECDQNTLLKALKYGRQNAPSVVQFLFENISKRMASQLEERMEGLGPVKLKEAEAAQAEVTGLIRKLAEAGEINLSTVSETEDEHFL